MPLNKVALKAAIKEAFDFESEKDVNPAEARARQAEKLANAFEDYLKSGDVETIVTGTYGGGVINGNGTGKVS